MEVPQQNIQSKLQLQTPWSVKICSDTLLT